MVSPRLRRLPLRSIQVQTPFICRSCIVRTALWRRSTRIFHSSSRLLQNHDSAVTVGSVKVKRKFFSFRRAALFVFYGFGTYSLTNYVLNKIPLDEEDEEYEEDEEHEEDEDVENEVDEDGNIIRVDSGALFIPFQYPRQLPPTFYRGSDPEWQEFIKVDRNKEKQLALKQQLADRVCAEISKVPKVRQALGNNVAVKRWWLDTVFPDSPPPEYARSGIEINDEFIAWSTQIIPQSHYVQLHHFMWPRAVFNAAYLALSCFGRLQNIKIKERMGGELTASERNLHKLNQHHQKFEALQKKKLDDAQDTSSQDSKTPASPSESAQQIATHEKRSLNPFAAPSTGSDPTDPSHHNPRTALIPEHAKDLQLFRSIPLATDMKICWVIFGQNLAAQWKRTRESRMPRGCFFVTGHVELKGTKGRCKVEVTAVYDPTDAKFVSISLKPTHAWENRQKAKGGP